MPLSLNNSKDIVANSISIIKGNKTVDFISSLDAVTGLAPETLNSLEKLANALNGDSSFFPISKHRTFQQGGQEHDLHPSSYK